jgi:hypothetical protein
MIAHKPLFYLVGRPRFERGTIALKVSEALVLVYSKKLLTI